jgi:hypothetical protein
VRAFDVEPPFLNACWSLPITSLMQSPIRYLFINLSKVLANMFVIDMGLKSVINFGSLILGIGQI